MKNTYRPEIDGLRALAVLSVIFFHAGINLFKGGFVGVDIFFVISGYLITTIILKDIEKKKFSLAYFYQRRVRRILPALIITIALSLPFALILLPPSDLQNYVKSIFSSLTFWSNFQFSSETGYFATPGEYKPLLHTWSLSIEEQFYILYPLFFIFFFKFKKKFFNSIIILILFLSLAFAQWSGNLNFQFPFIDEDLLFYSQSFLSEFMMPFGRVWELALGAVCAFLINSNKNYFQVNQIKNNKALTFNACSFFGILLVLFSFFYLSKNFPYPSFYTLIPAVGTALLLLFSQKNTFTQKILSYKILVLLGLISYSAYLFHYPVFSFIKYTSININNSALFYIIPLILFFSFLNWKFVEKPFRDKNLSLKKLFFFIGFSYFLLILISSFIHINKGLDNRAKFMLPESIEESFVLPKKGYECFDIDYVHKEHNQKNICKIGNIKKEKIDFLIFGDSHIVSFYPLFNNLLKNNNKSGLFVGYSGCPPILNVYTLRKDQKERNCYQLNKLISRIVKEQEIKNLILISKWAYYTDGNPFGENLNPLSLKPRRSSNKSLSRKAFSKGMADTLKNYEKLKTNIFIVEQVPHQLSSPKHIYYRSFYNDNFEFNNKLTHYSLNLNMHNKHQNFVKKIFNKFNIKYKNLTLINFDDIFCNKEKGKCIVGNEKYSFYYSNSHLSTRGANLTKNKLAGIVEKF